MSKALLTFHVAFGPHHRSSLIIPFALDASWDLQHSLCKLTILIHNKGLENSHILFVTRKVVLHLLLRLGPSLNS